MRIFAISVSILLPAVAYASIFGAPKECTVNSAGASVDRQVEATTDVAQSIAKLPEGIRDISNIEPAPLRKGVHYATASSADGPVLLKSVDDGVSWKVEKVFDSAWRESNGITALDIHRIRVDNFSEVYLATSQGLVYSSTGNDKARTFRVVPQEGLSDVRVERYPDWRFSIVAVSARTGTRSYYREGCMSFEGLCGALKERSEQPSSKLANTRKRRHRRVRADTSLN